jgi:hypothetical protein
MFYQFRDLGLPPFLMKSLVVKQGSVEESNFAAKSND